jgi:hypothetical protein
LYGYSARYVFVGNVTKPGALPSLQ